VDRGTEATLTRTVLRSRFKSYTKDWTPPRLELVFCYSDPLFYQFHATQPRSDLGPKAILTHENRKEEHRSPISSMDSGLEAFSRNPTHGSFSAWTFPSTEWTNYVNQRFLSYWIGLLSR
jgi:hypothetical protein